MFSKLFAFGLGALAVVRAAPALSFQNQLLSCSVNLDASVAPVKSFDAIEPGPYKIYNEALPSSTPLRTYATGQAVVVGSVFPGGSDIWWVGPSGYPGSNEYTITNTGLEAGITVQKEKVVTIEGQGDTFAISPAGQGTYTIQVPNEDKVWAVTPGRRASAVYALPQDGRIQSKWRFVPARG